MMVIKHNLGLNSLGVKLVRFFAIGFVVLGIMLAFTAVNNSSHLEELYKTRSEEERSILLRDLDNMFRLTKAFAPDYSQWDDPYNYLLGKLPNYAKENLTNDTLQTFESDAVWMYKKDGTLVYKNHTDNITTEDSDLRAYLPKIIEQFKTNYLIEFNVRTKQGFMRIYGSTVVPTADNDHIQSSPGFVLVGKQVSSATLEAFEGGGRDLIEFVNDENSSGFPEKYPARTGLLAFSVAYTDIQGNYIGKVYATYQDSSIKQLHDSDTALLIFNIISFLGLIAGLLIFTWRRVIRPINKLYRALETADTELITSMMKDKSEFGRLAELLGAFFEQEAALEREVEEKKNLLARLAAYNTEIETTNNVMIGRELKMIELKKEIEALKKMMEHDHGK